MLIKPLLHMYKLQLSHFYHFEFWNFTAHRKKKNLLSSCKFTEREKGRDKPGSGHSCTDPHHTPKGTLIMPPGAKKRKAAKKKQQQQQASSPQTNLIPTTNHGELIPLPTLVCLLLFFFFFSNCLSVSQSFNLPHV